MRPARFTDPAACVEDTLSRVGPRIVLATPLGLGKSVPLVNAFYARAVEDPGIELVITTALTLEPPHARGRLEGRLVEPLVQRLFAGYPQPRWLADQRRDRVPGNVHIREFFFQPGSRMGVAAAQRQYISDNYTHVVRDLVVRGVNVLAQMVAPATAERAGHYSLSCNPDLTLDLLPHLAAAEQRGVPVAVLGQVNPKLPYMYGHSEVPAARFHAVVEGPAMDHPLFGVPNTPVSDADYGIAAYASCLIPDGGTLQLGIGAMGDAITRLLLLRQQDNATYWSLLSALDVSGRFGDVVGRTGGTEPFRDGVYAATEMLVDGYLALYRSDILKRKVYPHAGVQELLNERRLDEQLDRSFLETLRDAKIVAPGMSQADFDTLRDMGVFPEGARLMDGAVRVANDLVLDLDDPQWPQLLAERLHETVLQGGVVAHAGFFLGPRSFYEGLAALEPARRRHIDMTRISFVNELYGNERLKRAQRTGARFLNSGLIATLLGHVVSDALEDGRVISGVGGQYNFVAMAHALADGRSILMVRSTRGVGRALESNILWNYGHTTIPRHLRDIVVTEYGIADLRGCSDEECIQRMLNVTDSRFQDALEREAKRARKLASSYRIPERFRNNRPDDLRAKLADFRDTGCDGRWDGSLLCDYPFGTDLTREEAVLAGALRNLADHVQGRRLPRGWWRAVGNLLHAPRAARPYLERMGLDRPRSPREWLEQRVVTLALALHGAL